MNFTDLSVNGAQQILHPLLSGQSGNTLRFSEVLVSIEEVRLFDISVTKVMGS